LARSPLDARPPCWLLIAAVIRWLAPETPRQISKHVGGRRDEGCKVQLGRPAGRVHVPAVEATGISHATPAARPHEYHEGLKEPLIVETCRIRKITGSRPAST